MENWQVLRSANLLGKTWPIRMSCRRAAGKGGKVIHFIRHGQGSLVSNRAVVDLYLETKESHVVQTYIYTDTN